MENIINYYYGINVKKIDDHIVYDYDNNIYYIEKVDGEKINRFLYIDSLLNNVSSTYFYCYRFLHNKYNDLFTKVDADFYVLVKLDDNYNKVVDLTQMVEFYDKSSHLINAIKSINWDVLWENKINSLHLKINNNHVSNKNIAPLFYYYMGVAENAICYLKKSNNGTEKDYILSFNHYRIKYPVRYIDFYNPLSIYVDFCTRDISEYIKSVYYNGFDYITELEYFLKTKKLSLYEAKLLYARIVYPSHFIDYFLNKDNKKNYHIFYKTKEYESFLLNTYKTIYRHYKIPDIRWIIDQH